MKGRPSGYKLSPNEEARLLKEARESRRKQRLLQVREQAKLNAAKLRHAVKDEHNRQIQKLERQIKEEWERERQEKLRSLEEVYARNVNSVGESHTSAALQEPMEEKRALMAEIDNQRATLRYHAALQKLREDNTLREEEENRPILLRKAALEAERERAAEVAARPTPAPDPVSNIEAVKVRPVKFTDIDAFSSTHLHIPEVCHVEKAELEQQEDARKSALEESEKLEDLTEQQRRHKLERHEKALLRHKHALRKELLKHDYENMLHDLSDLQRADMNRRQNIVHNIPKQIFLPPHRRVEEREERQRDMEQQFEDMYMAATEFMGDLSLALDPHPAPETPSATETLELSLLDPEAEIPANGETGVQLGGGGRGIVPSGGQRAAPMLRDVTNQPLETAQGQRAKPTPDGLRRLLSRIKSQRDHWLQKTDGDVPAKDQEEQGHHKEAVKAKPVPQPVPASLSQYTLTSDDVTASEPTTLSTGEAESTVPSSLMGTESSVLAGGPTQMVTDFHLSHKRETPAAVVTLPEPPARRDTLSSGTLTETLSEGTLTPSTVNDKAAALVMHQAKREAETLLHPLEEAERVRGGTVPSDLSAYLGAERQRQESLGRDARQIAEDAAQRQQLLVEQKRELERRLAEINDQRQRLTSELSLRQSQQSHDSTLERDSQTAHLHPPSNHVTFAPQVESFSQSCPANQDVDSSDQDVSQTLSDMSAVGTFRAEEGLARSNADWFGGHSLNGPTYFSKIEQIPNTQSSGYFTQSNLPTVTPISALKPISPLRLSPNLSEAKIPKTQSTRLFSASLTGHSVQRPSDNMLSSLPHDTPYDQNPTSGLSLQTDPRRQGVNEQYFNALATYTAPESFQHLSDFTKSKESAQLHPKADYISHKLPLVDQQSLSTGLTSIGPSFPEPISLPTTSMKDSAIPLSKPFQSLPEVVEDPRLQKSQEYQRQLLIQHRGRFEELDVQRQQLSERARQLLDPQLGTTIQLQPGQSIRSHLGASVRSHLSDLGQFQDVDVSGSMGNLSSVDKGEVPRLDALERRLEETKTSGGDGAQHAQEEIQALKEKWMRDFLQSKISDSDKMRPPVADPETQNLLEESGGATTTATDSKISQSHPALYGERQLFGNMEKQNTQETGFAQNEKINATAKLQQSSESNTSTAGQSWHQRLLESSVNSTNENQQDSVVREQASLQTDPEPLVFEIDGPGSPPMIRKKVAMDTSLHTNPEPLVFEVEGPSSPPVLRKKDAVERSGRLSSTPLAKSRDKGGAGNISLESENMSHHTLGDHTSWMRSMEPDKSLNKKTEELSEADSTDRAPVEWLMKKGSSDFEPLHSSELTRDDDPSPNHISSSRLQTTSEFSRFSGDLSQHPLSTESTRFQTYTGDLLQQPLSAEVMQSRFSAYSDELSQYPLSQSREMEHQGDTATTEQQEHLEGDHNVISDDAIAYQVELSLAKHRQLMAKTQAMIDANSDIMSQRSMSSSTSSFHPLQEDRRRSVLSQPETGISDEPDLTLVSLESSYTHDPSESKNVPGQHGISPSPGANQSPWSENNVSSLHPESVNQNDITNIPLSMTNQSSNTLSSTVDQSSSLLSFEKHEQSVTDLKPRCLWFDVGDERSTFASSRDRESVGTLSSHDSGGSRVHNLRAVYESGPVVGGFTSLQAESYREGESEASGSESKLQSIEIGQVEESSSDDVRGLTLQDAFLHKKKDFIKASTRRKQEAGEKAQAAANSQQGTALGKTLASWKRSRALNQPAARSGKPTRDATNIQDTFTSADRAKAQRDNKARTLRLYNKLDEVKKQKQDHDRKKFYTENREKAKEYTKKQQAQMKKKQDKK